MAFVSEAQLEEWVLDELRDVGFSYLAASAVSPEAPARLRPSFRDAILTMRFHAAVSLLNPDLPEGAVRDVITKVGDAVLSADPIAENERIHRLLVDGVKIEYWVDGAPVSAHARLVDWSNAENDWLAVNQFEIVGKSLRFTDVVLFRNGLPLVVVELKGTEGADLPAAFNQIETYKADVPEIFRANLLSVISDGITARYGSVSADLDRYMLWRTVDGETLVEETSALAIETMVKGLLSPETLLAMLRGIRGRGQRARQEDRGLPPVPRGPEGRGVRSGGP